ncbi:MAG TPA: FAD-binding oxidoreductase [Stellaceae bacterium]|nr:FAD-binding oxidoreductase [Stellaceae bacterium]
MDGSTPDIINRLKQIVGTRGYLDQPADIAPYLVEQRGLYRGATPIVLRPGSTEEVAAIVKLCAASRVPVVPQGGNTGLCGGGVPNENGRSVVVALGRMNRVRHLDPVDFTITVEAGCVLADIQNVADAADRLFPLSLGAEGSCQIGGNLSTNAGGVGVLRYGNTRDLCLGLEVVLPDGQVWNGLRGLRKDNTGYALKHLFIGGEGTLGIITAATMKLFPKPREVETAFLGLNRVDDAMALFARAREASGDQLTAFELIPRIGLDIAIKHVAGVADPLARSFPWYVLMEVSSSRQSSGLRGALEEFLAETMENGLIADGAVASSTAQARAFWRIREGLVEAQKFEGGGIKHDVSVPVSQVAKFIMRATKAVKDVLPEIRPVAFGHVGDGNVHFNLCEPVGADSKKFLARWDEFARIVHDIVADMDGSFSAEHGIGRLKVEELAHYRSALELSLMRKIKNAIDPLGEMNPGKILAS